MTDEELQREAELRRQRARDAPSSRPLSEGYEEVGLKGERLFERTYGVKSDYDPSLPGGGGDGGHDYIVPLMVKVDVKSARIPKHLWVEVGHVRADIYVLARVGDEGSMDEGEALLGWAWAGEVLAAPVIKTPAGVMSHSILASKLRPMRAFGNRLVRAGLVQDR